VLKHIQEYHDKAYSYLHQVDKTAQELLPFEALAKFLLQRDK
jgi:geranylgeranyl pyrophosphate synthase